MPNPKQTVKTITMHIVGRIIKTRYTYLIYIFAYVIMRKHEDYENIFICRFILEPRRGRVVRAARLQRRKSPYRVSSRLGFAMRRLEKLGKNFELGKDNAAKGEGWPPPFISCAQDTVGL